MISVNHRRGSQGSLAFRRYRYLFLACLLFLSLFQIDRVLSDLIEGGYGFGVGFECSLGHDEIGNFGAISTLKSELWFVPKT